MNRFHEKNGSDNQKSIYKSVQSSCGQFSNLSMDKDIDDREICANIDPMDRKSSGRSWTRSKRISLGCLEWRSRAPIRQTSLGSCNRMNNIEQPGSHYCIVHTEEDSIYTNEESSKLKVKHFRPKYKSGADNLLQRLRKRSFSRDKNKRDNSRTRSVNSNNINNRSSSAPRSVYSYESRTESELNHCYINDGGNNYSLLQMNKCTNLSVPNLTPKIVLSRSVPELKGNNCNTDYSCLSFGTKKPSECVRGYEETSTYQCNLTYSDVSSSTKIKINDQMLLSRVSNSPPAFPLLKDNNTSIVREQFDQSGCHSSSNTNPFTYESNNFSSGIISGSSHLEFSTEYADVPNTMNFLDSVVFPNKQQQQQQYGFALNPLISSMYSEVCPKCHCTCDNNDDNTSSIHASNMNKNSTYVQNNSHSCMKHSEAHYFNNSSTSTLPVMLRVDQPDHEDISGDMSNMLSTSDLTDGRDVCQGVDTRGEKFTNIQITTLNNPTISNCTPSPTNVQPVVQPTGLLSDMPVDHVSMSCSTQQYQTLDSGNNMDFSQTQHNSSCNSLRPDSLLSTSTTTRESSYSDLSPNSLSSHDSALGGGKLKSDNMGQLKTTTIMSSTTNYMKNVEQLKYMKSPDMTCLTNPINGSNNNNNNMVNTKDLCQIPPMCLPPSGNYGCSHTPPTPIRRPWLGDNQERIATGRSRSGGQKRSVYVNASIYPIPEMMRNTEANGNNRSSRVRDRPNPYENSIATNPILLSPPGSNISTAVGNNNNNDKGTQNNASTTQIPYWTHLLPYRTSTVPQNLSGRLRKSETLPNDWINHDANKSTDHEKYSFSKSTSYQLNTLNQTHNSQCFNYSEECKPRSYVNHQYNNYTNNNHSSDSDHKKAKSPPPRPPIRTSSHNVSRQTPISLSPQSSASRSPCCHHLHCRKHLSQGLLNSSTKSNINGNSNNNVFVQDSTNSSINESPVLCRYSQLYSLNTQNKMNNGSHNSSLPINSTSTSTTPSTNCSSVSSSVHHHKYSLYDQHHNHQHHHHSIQFKQPQMNPHHHMDNCKQLVELDMQKLEINQT